MSGLFPAGHDAFYAALGRFIATFAIVENTCHGVFHHICGLPQDAARALIGGRELSTVTSVLNRTVKAREPQERQDEVQALIDQINTISELRHALIHRETGVWQDDITASNMATAKYLESIEMLRLDLKHITNATDDLNCIHVRLLFITQPWLRSRLNQATLDAIFLAWRYV
jgi:hypothetical protein